MSYDSVCMNDQCIRKKQSFFQFDLESQHFANRHNVKSIHPLTYATFFQKDERSDQNINREKLSEEASKFRDEAFQSTVEAIRSFFYDDKVIPTFETVISLSQNLSIKSITTGLCEGNYSLLEYIKLFQLQRKERNFGSFMTRKVKQMQQQIKRHFTNLKTAFLDVCQGLKMTQKPNQVRKQNQVIPPMANQKLSSENIPNPITQKPPAPIIPPVQRILVKEQYIPRPYQYSEPVQKKEKQEKLQHMDDQEIEDEQESEGQENNQNADKDKVKLIHKDSKRSKKRRKRYNFMDGIEIISQQEVIVKQSRYPLKTLTFLQEKYPLMTTIHILHETLANKQAIKRILQTFPRIKRITINCYFEFQPEILKQVPQKLLEYLQIELKWDMSKFFTEYFAYCYFPFKTIKRRERKKPVDIEEISKLLPRNNSLWSYDFMSHDKIDTLTLNYDSITALHYENTEPSAYLSKTFSLKLRNIQTLILKNFGVGIYSTPSFGQFIDNNKLIKTIIIADCSIDQDYLNFMVAKMKELPYLSKLSLSRSESQRSLNPESIFNLANLTHLNIERYIFTNQQSEWSSTDMKNIFKLSKLQYLSLTGCSVSSEILSYLSPNCLNALTYLNLGKTNMTKDACQFIKKMQKLQYLNIDCTCIGGDSLVDVFRSMARLSIIDVPLKYLSIQNQWDTLGAFSIDNMKQMARYLPRLVYLNIAHRKNLADYGFNDFKNLKTLAVDKEQYEKLEEIIAHEITRYKIEYQDKKQWRYNPSSF